MQYQLGDHVFILAKRTKGGVHAVPPESPSAPGFPVAECVVAQTDVCGVEGCYGLVWADDGEPVGLPFSERSMFDSPEELQERIEACQVPM